MCNTICVVGSPSYYYLGFFSNHQPNANNSIVLITTEAQEVQYSIEAPGVDYHHNGTISAGNELILNLPAGVEVLSNHDQDKGIFLTTNSNKVTVIGQSLRIRTSESFTALPITTLNDVTYIYYGISVPRTTVHNFPFNSSILMVGTEDSTLMKLTVTQSVNISVCNTDLKLIPGKQYSFLINRLQTVYIGSPEDLTGTKIVTDKPISVLSGHQCSNVPWNIPFCNYIIEQIPPTTLWGKVFYTAPLATRRSYTIKILAAYNFTIVNIYCNNTMELYSINEGESVNKTSSLQEYCAIHSNKKVLVVQFSHGGDEEDEYEEDEYGDPMMTLVPAINQYLNKFDFSTINNSNFNHFVNVIVTAQYYQPNMIYLIAGGVNRSLVREQWVPIQINNLTKAYATQVNISHSRIEIFHTNTVAQMMVIVYGFSYHDGYGHIGGVHLSAGYLLISYIDSFLN